MNRALLAVALVAGCRTGNFLTVDVIGIPCEASSLHVTLELDGGTITDHTFTDAARIGDGATSFAVDLGGHHAGMVLVTVETSDRTGPVSGSNTAALPASSITIDLHGGGNCSTNDGMPDGGEIDAAVIPDADRSCGWNVEPTNYAPCAPGFPPATGPFDIIDTQVVNTDTEVGKFHSVVYQLTGEVLLIHATSFSMTPTSGLIVIGTRPLLLVVDGDATIAGSINLSAAASPPDCPITPADDGSASGPGGAGAGFATPGGAGGNNGDTATVVGPAGGGVIGNALLSPLRPGCAGGRGGRAAGSPGGGGGNGGGGLEISSNAMLTIHGTITSGGGGGNAGMPQTLLRTPFAMEAATGGGGGGAGGAILLEAAQIDLAGAMICAAGGGGGEGGDPVTPSVGGTQAACGGGPGGAASVGGDGGSGGDGTTAPGAGGTGRKNLSGASTGGGGGGGSPGRIRVHGPRTGAATIVPAPAS